MPIDRPTGEEIERVIGDAIARRLERRHGSRPSVTGEQTFEALGIDSLDLHELVDDLEAALRLNPFEHGYSINDVRTVGDLFRSFRTASHDGATPPDADEALLASRKRAAARRRSRS